MAVAAPVPTHWMSYAALAGNELQLRLSDEDSKGVTRLYDWLEQPQVVSPRPEPLVVRVWISSRGNIERAEFETLGDPQVDADLRALLTSEPLSAPPPADMKQPLVLGLSLRANPDYPSSGPDR
jgi:hypothetical protein